MNEDKRLEKQLGKAFGIVAAFVQVFYWVRAVEVSHHASIVDGESEPYWNRGGAGSFFPLPKEPGMLAVVTEMSGTDQFIYYLIHYHVFPLVALAFIALFWLLGRVVGKGLTKY